MSDIVMQSTEKQGELTIFINILNVKKSGRDGDASLHT